MGTRSKLAVYIDSLWLTIGEAIVALAVVGGFAIFGKFSYEVVTGAIIGGVVTVMNFLILSISVNRAIDKFIHGRGAEEMSDEDAQAYVQKCGMSVQVAMVRSYVLRLILMIGVLVLALISGWFSPLATVIPLLMYRPVLYVVEFIKAKFRAKEGENTWMA